MANIERKMILGLLIYFLFEQHLYVDGGRDLETKVVLLTAAEQEDPKCFAEGMADLTCFWEEDDDGDADEGQHTFKYKYQNENSSDCAVTVQPAGGGRTRYFCKLSRVVHFSSLNVHVFRNGKPLHSRNLTIDSVFLLDPPANLTVRRTGKPGQLRLIWLPLSPSLKHLTNSMMYEISYAPAGSPVEQVTVVRRNTETMLHSLLASTTYNVRVRAKPSDLTYNGYWSAWTPTVSIETPPNDLDPLIIILCLIIFVIFAVLSLTAFLFHRRFLLKKMWPPIPSPENQFPGLFTVYGGDFLEWLSQSSGLLWRRPSLFYTEELSAPLEVLSEARDRPVAPTPAPPPTASGLLRDASLEEDKEGRLDSGFPHDENWLINQLKTLQGHPIPRPLQQPTLLETKDTYVTLTQSSHLNSGGRTPPLPPDDISEESSPLNLLFMSTEASASYSDLGSLQQSSRSGELSAQSSFEYPNSSWLPKGPRYPYLAVADSGISTDYSLMSSSMTSSGGHRTLYANDYKNHILQQRHHPTEGPVRSWF
ncbi:hypothetical protein AGOR_G00222280 [Albula goreensis]|uniref:Erythropoietin receptor n=1 Tax=Albula goreensis TaxID=1534307 RepID=A0A8T3CJN7_9TELE|nr:hypothetical protein AGOR_G00222280 [Albula goreensis]